VNDFPRFVQKGSILGEDADSIDVELKDDDGILSAAVRGGVDALVTGDKEMQDLGNVAGSRRF
jgi:hypothetical protein